MTATDTVDAHGPIDYLLLEFPGDDLQGHAADALMDLVRAGVIRIYDLLVVRKNDDGSFAGIEVSDISADHFGGFTVFAGTRSGLLGDDDVSDAAGVMRPGTVGALVVYENTWAIPFVAAARDAGAHVVASARIPAATVTAVLDELETTDGDGRRPPPA